PAESRNVTVPVQTGWHFEQTWTMIFGLVLRVLKELPQPQVTVQSWYLGWIPSFIAGAFRRRGAPGSPGRVGKHLIISGRGKFYEPKLADVRKSGPRGAGLGLPPRNRLNEPASANPGRPRPALLGEQVLEELLHLVVGELVVHVVQREALELLAVGAEDEDGG